jgi:hypothetical protein
MNMFFPCKFRQARDFVDSSARPLERALAAFHLDGGPAHAVYAELRAFQNEDGGFGHGLEADVRLADSSVIATTVALQILHDLDTPSHHALISGAMRYLLETYHPETSTWEPVPRNVSDMPHAPWWTYTPDHEKHGLNPTAEIIGGFHDYPRLVKIDLIEALDEIVVSRIEAAHGALEMHELLCCIRLAERKRVLQITRVRIIEAVKPSVEQATERNPSKWAGYVMTPLDVAPTPGSLFASMLKPEIDIQLDYLVEQLGKGPITPNWQWGDHSEAWEQAKTEWTGVLTLQAMKRVKAWGRM